MEYEVYWLCNLLGMIIIAIVILFHFIEADKKPKALKDQGKTNIPQQAKSK
jgi:hypothetical protein